MNEWMNELINELMNSEWMNEWINEWQLTVWEPKYFRITELVFCVCSILRQNGMIID